MCATEGSGGSAGPVMIVNLAKRYGGAEVRTLAMARGMHGRVPYTVTVLRGSPLHVRLEESGLSVSAVGHGRGNPLLLSRLVREIRKGRYRVVDAHNVQSLFWVLVAARLWNLPRPVATVHSSYRTEKGGVRGLMYEYVLRRAGLEGCRFIAVSESIVEYLTGIGIEERRIVLIRNGIEVTDRNEKGSGSLRRSIGWGDDCFVILTACRLEKVKGLEYLTEAVASVAAERPGIRWLVCGEGRERGVLEQRVRSRGIGENVFFAGFRDDVRSLMAECDAFCLPSLTEGLPYALLEACAERLPVLATAVGGMARLLTDGETAILVPPEDAEALAAGIERLIADPRLRNDLARTAFELVREKLSVTTMTEQTLRFYETAM